MEGIPYTTTAIIAVKSIRIRYTITMKITFSHQNRISLIPTLPIDHSKKTTPVAPDPTPQKTQTPPPTNNFS